MVLSAKWNKGNGERWGMGFLLVLFPEGDESSNSSFYHNPHSRKKKKTFHSLSSPSAAGSRLISKTQSTLSICGLLVFTTFLLFTLSTFEPAAAISGRSAASSATVPRRLLLPQSKPSISLSPPFPALTTRISSYIFHRRNPQSGAVNGRRGAAIPPALQGMGILYRKGTRAMANLVVAHVPDDVEEREFRAFLRILHNNGLLSRSDLVFLFSSPSISSRFSHVIMEENESFLQLVAAHSNGKSNGTAFDLPSGLARYFRESGEKVAKEAIWGKTGGGRGNANYTDSDESNQPSYGSVVAFDALELDPENSLSGFLDSVPLGLRRWACYPMLLGRVRRKYKHMALADVKDLVILNDPFIRARNRSPESVFLWTHPETVTCKRARRGPHHHHHHNQHFDQKASTVVKSPGIVVGGSRGVRRLSDAVLTEIVRSTIERSSNKGKVGKNSAASEAGIVNQLVHGGHLWKKVDLVVNVGEAITEAGELAIGSESDGPVWAGRSA